MLSADPVVGLLDAFGPDELEQNDAALENPPLEVDLLQEDAVASDSTYQENLQYDPADNLDDLFTGLSESDNTAAQI